MKMSIITSISVLFNFFRSALMIFIFSANIYPQLIYGPNEPDLRRDIYSTDYGPIQTSGLLDGNSIIYIGCHPQLSWGSGPERDRYRGLYQWNYDDNIIPDGSTITSVNLSFTADRDEYTGAFTLDFYNIESDLTNPNIESIFNSMYPNLSPFMFHAEEISYCQFNISVTSPHPLISAIQNSLVNNRFTLGIRENWYTWNAFYRVYSWTLKLSIEFTPPTQLITLDQKLSTGQQVGVLRKWEGDHFTDPPFNPGSQFYFQLLMPQVLLGDQSVHSSEKYLNWQGSQNVKNHREIIIPPLTNTLTSNFIPTNSGVTIKNSLEGTNVIGGTLFFRDPWFIDTADVSYANTKRNRGMDEAKWWNRESPFYPNESINFTNGSEGGQKYNGVFLNQTPDPNEPLKPYYKLWAGDQQINLGSPLGVRPFYFQDWSSNQYATLQKFGSDANVVFTGGNAVVQANYKGHMLSNHPATLNSQQRKMIHIGGDVFYLVYESMDKCWVTEAQWGFSDQWQEDTDLSKKNSSLNQLASFKNPSVDNVGETVFIAFEYLEPGSSTAYIMLARDFSYLASDLTSPLNIEIIDSYPASFFGHAKPLVAAFEYNSGGSTDDIVVLYKKSPSQGLYYRNYGYNGGIYNWRPVELLTGTSGASVNFSIAPAKNTTDHKLHIAYEENMTSIKYLCLYAFPSKLLNGQATISTNSPYLNNYSPSISVTGQNKIVVSWTGASGIMIGKGNGTEAATEYKTIIRPYESSWGNFQVAGNYVSNTYSSSTTNTSQSQSIISWNENQNTSSKYLRRLSTSYCATNTLTPNGIMPVVSAASNLSEARALVLNTSTTPYGLYKSTTNFNEICELEDEGDLEKITTDGSITYGRTGIIFINGVGFIFQTGDVVVGDSTIQFVHRPDTINYQSASELNEVVRTTPFNLDQNSTFLFSNKYYTLYGELADTALIATDNVSFRVELVNAATQNVIGTFDNITYNKNNLEKFENISYQVNCSGIQAGDYYIRLVTAVNGIAEYNLANVQSDASELEKNNFASVYFDGNGLPLTYEISQNYPNPFNPSTVINYQIPKDGLVTIKVYDILGKEVATLLNENKSVGRYSVQFDGNNLASGVYIYRINSGDFISSKKMMLIK